MRKPILFVCITLFAIGAHAQISISVNPGHSSAAGHYFSQDIGAYSQVTNNSQVPISLMWTRHVVSAPPEWASWICDMNFCYLPHVGSTPPSQPNLLEPGQSMNLEFHVGPDSTLGTGEYLLYLYDLNEPEVILDSIRYTIETSTTSVNDLNNSSLRIYPNPTTTYFQLSQGDQVERVVVHALVGSKVREFNARSTSRFDVSDLPQGIYIVRLMDANQQVLKTVRLSKR